MRNTGLVGLCFSLVAMMSGCASIVSGTNQPITVETRTQGNLLSGVTCKLINDKGTWYVTTPGSVTVHRSVSDLKLSCEKEGVTPGLANVKSNTKAMAFGNAIFGGLIGVGVDVASGAAFDYPDLVQVEMGGLTGTLASATNVAVAGSISLPSPVASPALPASSQALNKAPSPDNSATQTQTESPESYPRALAGPEIVTHFQRFNQLEIKQPRAFTLKIDAGGRVERECYICNVTRGQGTIEIKQPEGLACFKWYNVTYPESGCYRVLQTSKNEFSIDDALAHLQYSYTVPSQ